MFVTNSGSDRINTGGDSQEDLQTQDPDQFLHEDMTQCLTQTVTLLNLQSTKNKILRRSLSTDVNLLVLRNKNKPEQTSDQDQDQDQLRLSAVVQDLLCQRALGSGLESKWFENSVMVWIVFCLPEQSVQGLHRTPVPPLGFTVQFWITK